MTETSDAQDQIVCPSCDTPADPQAVVCAVCGAVLAEGIESDQATQLLAKLRNALQGRYVLGTAIGLGRAGITLRARRQSGSNRDVAVKVSWDDPNARRDVSREAELAVQVVHPNVLPVSRIDVPPPLVAVEMPLVEGGTLGDLIDSGTPVPYQRVVEIVRSIGKALDEAHERGIIHGSLRPEKIHLDRDGNPLISGFMLGQFPSGDRDAPLPNTIGSPAYTAFEQRHNLQTIDGRADQFSLAVIVYEMLCGRRTWRIPEDGVLEVDAIEIMPHRAIAPSVPLSAGAAIKRATWKDPSYRYDTIDDFIGGLTGTALEGTPAEQLAKVDRGAVKSRSALWILMPLAALVVIAAGLVPNVQKTAVHWWHAAFIDNTMFRLGRGSPESSGPGVEFEQAPLPNKGDSPRESRGQTSGADHTRRGDSTAQYAATGDRPDRSIDPYPKNTPLPSNASDPNSQRTSADGPRTVGTARVLEPTGIAPGKSNGKVSSSGGGRISNDASGMIGSQPDPSGKGAASQAGGPATTTGLLGFVSIALKSGDTTGQVFVDGKLVGRPPLMWKATPGNHVVTLRSPGKTFAPMQVTITEHDTARAVFAPATTQAKP